MGDGNMFSNVFATLFFVYIKCDHNDCAELNVLKSGWFFDLSATHNEVVLN